MRSGCPSLMESTWPPWRWVTVRGSAPWWSGPCRQVSTCRACWVRSSSFSSQVVDPVHGDGLADRGLDGGAGEAAVVTPDGGEGQVAVEFLAHLTDVDGVMGFTAGLPGDGLRDGGHGERIDEWREHGGAGAGAARGGIALIGAARAGAVGLGCLNTGAVDQAAGALRCAAGVGLARNTIALVDAALRGAVCRGAHHARARDAAGARGPGWRGVGDREAGAVVDGAAFAATEALGRGGNILFADEDPAVVVRGGIEPRLHIGHEFRC